MKVAGRLYLCGASEWTSPAAPPQAMPNHALTAAWLHWVRRSSMRGTGMTLSVAGGNADVSFACAVDSSPMSYGPKSQL